MTLYQRQQSDDRNMQEMQSTLERTTRESFTSEIMQGNLIKNVLLKSHNEATRVNHKLGRKWIGFIVANLESVAGQSFGIAHQTDEKVDANTTIALTALGPVFPAPQVEVRVSLWIF